MLPGFPGANIKEFWLTILSEVKRPQTQCLSPKGEFWVCSAANSRMVQNAFQRAKGNPGNMPYSMEAKKQWSHLLKFFLAYNIRYLQRYSHENSGNSSNFFRCYGIIVLETDHSGDLKPGTDLRTFNGLNTHEGLGENG